VEVQQYLLMAKGLGESGMLYPVAPQLLLVVRMFLQDKAPVELLF
jgi:hypothetical protein